jgi:hypothetical protein
LLKDKKLVEQENMKVILMEQMQGKTQFKKYEKEKERELELINLQRV